YKPSQPYCVIKQFLPQAQGTDTIEKASQLFAQEAQRLEELGKHPQIPELMAYFIVNGRQYLVQEFVAGNTLQTELDQNGVFSEQQIRELLPELLQILEYVHSKQVIHRDIKPENIIRRSSDNKLFLVDFGAAKVVKPQQRTATGTIIGSAEYCAPEQSMGKPLFTSDLYSLGVTCLHLLTGVSPFDLYSPLEGEWVWRDYLNGNVVSDELGEMLEKLAHPIPKRRYQSVSEVIQALSPVSPVVTPAINPNYAQATARGLVYEFQKELDLAVADLNKAIGAITHLSRGNVYYNQQKWDLALAEYNKAIAINPNDAQAYYNRGNVYYNQQKWDLALADYTQAIRLNPNYAEAYYNRGVVYRKQQKWDLALADHNQAIKLNPNYAQAYLNRGNVYDNQQKWDLALADYTQAIKLNPNDALAYTARGLVYRNQQKWDLALADYNKAIGINLNDAQAYKDRGAVYLQLGDINKAREDLQRAAQLFLTQGNTAAYQKTIEVIRLLNSL
ncbi:serine/threonine-protein kinase, partial [Anabaena sp. CS-542/02]|uniref:serine/threonine-protein kinase n=1 Tax=Anabaena sp. CS-542/02 TaxID=3021719 RepID=UPI00233124ED